MKWIISFFITSLIFSCADRKSDQKTPQETVLLSKESESFESKINAKLPGFFKKMGKPEPGEWLSEHKEPGQTFEEYMISSPPTLTDKRNIIYLQPIGEMHYDDSLIVMHVADHLEAFYGVDIIINDGWPSDTIPDTARRTFFGKEQLLTTHIWKRMLKPNLPDNALASMAITPMDLYPKESWHYVFGQASTKNRVGVSSMCRLKDYDASNKLNKELSVTRISKTSSHEIGHMLGMKHCTKYKCIMNGSNHLKESDGKPIFLCPQCLQKMEYATGEKMNTRLKRLLEYNEKNGFKASNHYSALLKALTSE